MSTPELNELKLRQAINQHLDALVQQANTTAALLAKPQHARMEENQLRNLVNVASAGSVEVVVNFIRYQIARNGSAWGTGPNDFGHAVIADLRGPIKELADELAPLEQSTGEAFARLMHLYLGYLNRAFYYGKKTGNFDKLHEVANAR